MRLAPQLPEPSAVTDENCSPSGLTDCPAGPRRLGLQLAKHLQQRRAHVRLVVNHLPGSTLAAPISRRARPSEREPATLKGTARAAQASCPGIDLRAISRSGNTAWLNRLSVARGEMWGSSGLLTVTATVAVIAGALWSSRWASRASYLSRRSTLCCAPQRAALPHSRRR